VGINGRAARPLITVPEGRFRPILLSRRDIDFVLSEWLDIDQLTKERALRRALARDVRSIDLIFANNLLRTTSPHTEEQRMTRSQLC
jgi:hypothetical protein